MGGVRVERFFDARNLLVRAGKFLGEREAEHNLILGLAERLSHEPRPYGHDAHLAVVESGGEVVSAALQTPPHNLGLSEIDDGRAVAAIAAHARAHDAALPGALGPKRAVAQFAEEWRRLTGSSAELALAERIYRAASVIPIRGVQGVMRPYAPADRRLVLDWLSAFVTEAMPHMPLADPMGILERHLAEPEGRIVLWEDGGPVSLAAAGGPMPNGIRVDPVYTPPIRRGRGYASALVAGLTESLLVERQFCFLFTDLSNPTSNSIYQHVGYEPVTDVDQWSFA